LTFVDKSRVQVGGVILPGMATQAVTPGVVGHYFPEMDVSGALLREIVVLRRLSFVALQAKCPPFTMMHFVFA
jgi:hypothetical protein